MNECDRIMNKFAFVCSGYMMWLCVGGGWFLAHCRTHTQPTAFIIRPSSIYHIKPLQPPRRNTCPTCRFADQDPTSIFDVLYSDPRICTLYTVLFCKYCIMNWIIPKSLDPLFRPFDLFFSNFFTIFFFLRCMLICNLL